MPQYLGLDSSTQSLSALIVDTDTGKVVADKSVNFGERLPQYKSPKGFLPNDDASIKHSDPLMWVDALDLVLQELRAAGVDILLGRRLHRGGNSLERLVASRKRRRRDHIDLGGRSSQRHCDGSRDGRRRLHVNQQGFGGESTSRYH